MTLSLSRRSFLTSCCLGTSVAALALSASVHASGWLDASQLGVTPNAGRDQSVALQKAMSHAAKLRRPLFLPAGLYVVRDLELPSHLHLIGAMGQSQLLAGASAKFLLRAHGQKTIKLEGLTLRGSGMQDIAGLSALLDGVESHDLRIIQCHFLQAPQTGIRLNGVSGQIEDCRFQQLGRYGIFSRHAKGLWVQDNRLDNIGDGGILIHRGDFGPDGSRLVNNRISNIHAFRGGSGQYGNGINVFRADNVLISGNHISDCRYSAIRSNGAKQCHIIGNHCLGSGEVALFSEFEFDGAIIANNSLEGGSAGISIANFNRGGRRVSVSGNLIRNMTNPTPHDGPRLNNYGLYVEADAVVTGNNIEACPSIGMILGFGPYMRNLVASHNLVRGSQIGLAVSVVPKAGTALIDSNLFEGAQTAIAGFRWRDQSTSDLLGKPEKAPTNIRLHNNQSA
ncbi:MAG: TIGR03808 family TAT-translocated repetitive protein [Cohaesibacter sp.]|nr:TIGR03808 family TAT-translocated repetitive protein [Cohaesibacter sp.]